MSSCHFTVLALLLGTALSIELDKLTFGDVDHIVHKINSNSSKTWKAKKYYSDELNVKEVTLARTGALLDSSQPRKIQDEKKMELFSMPESYDPRARYPECTTISSIKDQANCGSCWSVSTASVLSDRLCIHSQGDIVTNVSATYVTGCVKPPAAFGCRGGYMDKTFDQLLQLGFITGGDFESDEGCQPYDIRPCGDAYTYPCLTCNTHTPKCRRNKCTNELYEKTSEEPFELDYWYQVSSKEKAIRREIYKNGPVVAAFRVPVEFHFYEKGVFDCEEVSRWVGGHAVRIIGWGVENGVPYWLVTNSWGKRWGEEGIFKMRRGYNDCDIEDNIFSLMPKIPTPDDD